MKQISDFNELPKVPRAVTFGKFDGVHLGHRQLIEKISEKSECGLTPTVFTFEKALPAGMGSADDAVSDTRALLSREEKLQMLYALGAACVFEYPVTEQTLSVTAEAFIEDVIAGALMASYIVVGEDFRFGCQRQGDVALLAANSKKYGYTLDVLKKRTKDGGVISSSRVRAALARGEMETVTGLLGYPYVVRGEIIRGNRLGRTFQVPTINLRWQAEKLPPRRGVYYSRVEIEGVSYCGLSNIGTKPSVEGEAPLGIETYLYGCDRNLYGKNAAIELLHFKREEQKFESVDALIARLRTDIDEGRIFHRIG